MQPQKPLRLVRPVRIASQPAAETSDTSSVRERDVQTTATEAPDLQESAVQRSRPPISPPDRPMQYRAIGLIEGQYHPSEEQLTRGTLKAKDGTEIDAVLLGRVMSLVRKHLEADKDYIWVVYPRTREQTNDLHVQIVGVWAPEEMGQLEPTDDSAVVPDFFSIRGEVIFQNREREFVIIKIWQSSRKNQPAKKPMAFKLRLEGQLEGNAVGQFWDLTVRRQGAQLHIAVGMAIGPATRPFSRKPTKRPRGKFPHPRKSDGAERSGPRPPKPKLRSANSTGSPPSQPES